MCTSLVPYSKKIPLTQGKFAMVGYWWYDFLMQWKWHAQKARYTFYAARAVVEKVSKKHHCVALHRFITNAPFDKLVDHYDRNGLNCHETNLRICSYYDNARNTRSRKGSTSKFLGVCYRKRDEIYQAQIKLGEKKKWLGQYKSEIDAAIAYNEAAKKYHGEFANLNIIDKSKLGL